MFVTRTLLYHISTEKWIKCKSYDQLKFSGIGTEAKNDLLNKNVFIL